MATVYKKWLLPATSWNQLRFRNKQMYCLASEKNSAEHEKQNKKQNLSCLVDRYDNEKRLEPLSLI